ncbi:serine protease HtrA [Romboutsia sp. 13368]|uniref:serine protease HtrA n=1 Tax=Romboutsia sp. 13368 TaxID=2708053 RepID=UPI0025E41D26|nr:trypsin-like peptidase domain-containing protein [Romboutsia sp. 13368]
MSKRRGIGLTVLICIITSVLTSLLTIVVMKNNIGNMNNDTSSKEIIVNDTGKSQNIYHAVSDKAMPSVVGITTTTISTDNIFAIPTQSEGVGTGVIVDSKGYILTNSHVVSDGQAADVKVLFNDGSTTQGKVLWNDAKLDLAIVKVDKTGLTAAELGDSDKVRVGDIAIAIGNPLGLEFQKSVTQGIISGLDRSIQTEKETMTGLMQTDASINPGNSGGPLLNEKGQVVGINSAKVSSAEGIGFSIPINTAKPIIEQVIKSGNFEKVTLGIKGLDVTTFETATGTDLAADEGVYIAEVVQNTPAQKAGIQTGDVIVKIGDIETPTMTDLNKALYKFKSGQSTKITLNRSGKEITVDVKF